MSLMGSLWLFMAAFSLGHCTTTMELTSSTRNGFLCPNESLILICVANHNQPLALVWYVNGTSVHHCDPTSETVYYANQTEEIAVTYIPLENATKSYLEYLTPPMWDLNVACEVTQYIPTAIIVQGRNPLPPVEIYQNNTLPNLVELTWENAFQNLTQYYEVKIDDEIYSKVQSTFIIIPLPADCANTYQNVTVTPVDHCGMMGDSCSLNISCTSMVTEPTTMTQPTTITEPTTMTEPIVTEQTNTSTTSPLIQQIEIKHIDAILALVAVELIVLLLFIAIYILVKLKKKRSKSKMLQSSEDKTKNKKKKQGEGANE